MESSPLQAPTHKPASITARAVNAAGSTDMATSSAFYFQLCGLLMPLPESPELKHTTHRSIDPLQQLPGTMTVAVEDPPVPEGAPRQPTA
mmetsp:Transcript_137552/g.294034  ORF Transcript_137552/g.294034 Transcript_137552/m.294034 type:complete len:90 (+) Transcript_137552:1278-1547(+)